MVTGQVVKVVKTLYQSNVSLRTNTSSNQKWFTYISVVVVKTTGVDV